MRSRTRDDSLRHISSSSKGYRVAILNVQGLVLLGVLAEPEGSSRSLPFKRARLLCFETFQIRQNALQDIAPLLKAYLRNVQHLGLTCSG